VAGKNVHRICTMAQRFNTTLDSVDFGRRLRKARKRAGLTLEQLQDETGIDHSQISRIECGRAVTMSANVQKLSTRLSVPLPGATAAGRPGELGRRVQRLAQSTPGAAEAIAAVVTAFERLGGVDG
jgi:transcriptional regulator with XRE-family HTH domain